MNSEIQAFWRRCESEAPIFTAEEVEYWSEGSFETLTGPGLLRETTRARFVRCDACGEDHLEEVQWIENAAGELVPYIACPEVMGARVNPERLRRWAVDLAALAAAAARGLDLAGSLEPVVPGRVWYLGRRNVAGRHREFFLACGINHQDGPALFERCGRMCDAAPGVLLLPASPPRFDAWKRPELPYFRLIDTATLDGGGLRLDLGYITSSLAGDASASNRPATSFPVPEGAPWDELHLTLRDHAIIATLGEVRREFTLADLGLSDDRRDGVAGTAIWELLRIFASCGGETPPRPPETKEKDRVAFRKQVSVLRKWLKSVFPIPDDPIPSLQRSGAYRCTFHVRFDPACSFATPPGTNWDDCMFVELADGRVAVSVRATEYFAAGGEEDHQTGERRSETAQREGLRTTTFDLRGIGYAKQDGELTPEGRVLVAFLRGDGKLQRPGDDSAVLKLGMRLSKWMGIESPPFQFTPRRVRWDAMFECRSLRVVPGS